MWKNVHPVYSAGIPTHNYWYMNLPPQPLDQGFLSCLNKISCTNDQVVTLKQGFTGWNHPTRLDNLELIEGLLHKTFFCVFTYNRVVIFY